MKRLLSITVCLCVIASCMPFGCLAAGGAFTQIGDVRFYGGAYLDTVDFSAVISDVSTVSGRTLHLCRVYDEGTAYESADRIANFVFDETRPGVAVLDDYPGAEARIEPGAYLFRAVDGVLFDDVDEYRFSAKTYYQNADPDAVPAWRPGSAPTATR